MVSVGRVGFVRLDQKTVVLLVGENELLPGVIIRCLFLLLDHQLNLRQVRRDKTAPTYGLHFLFASNFDGIGPAHGSLPLVTLVLKIGLLDHWDGAFIAVSFDV